MVIFHRYVTNYQRICLKMSDVDMGNGPFIDVPVLKNVGSFHGYVSHNQMVDHKSWGSKF